MDVIYYDMGFYAPFEVADFQTTEASFDSWVHRISRKPVERKEGEFRAKAFNVQTLKPAYLEISNGLLYSWQEKDRGERFMLDRTTGRAYYQVDFR